MTVTEAGSKRQWPPRLSRVLRHLVCPTCRRELIEDEKEFRCSGCQAVYPIRGHRIYFTAPPAHDDAMDVLKGRLKRHLGSYYYRVGMTVFAPGFPFNYAAAIRRHLDPRDQIVVDVGSGNNRIDENILALDSTDYDAVDIVADINALPFRDGSIDALCNRSVLEHIPEPLRAVAELARCTRPGGLGIHVIPFLFPYHASPHDYSRFTHTGAAALFRGWDLVDQHNTTGPITLFLVCLLEFLSSLLSLGHQQIKAFLYLVLCLMVFPLKILDAPFIGRPAFLGLAPTILTIVRKQGAQPP